MTLPTHLIAGFIIGKITGNYPLAIASSLLVDFDHIYSYVKSGVLWKPKQLWETLTGRDDPYGNQRGYLHNFFIFAFVSVILFLIFGNVIVALIFGWFGHLLLDALDHSDYWPLYPYKGINLKGPIQYASYQESVFFAMLAILYFFI